MAKIFTENKVKVQLTIAKIAGHINPATDKKSTRELRKSQKLWDRRRCLEDWARAVHKRIPDPTDPTRQNNIYFEGLADRFLKDRVDQAQMKEQGLTVEDQRMRDIIAWHEPIKTGTSYTEV